MSEPILLHVNGQTHSIQVAPETPLIFVLRNDLGLKAAKLACGLEQCGACLVLLDGQAAPSCRLPVAAVQGRAITTLEGLGVAGRLHPLQEAFLAEQAAQCGYCTAGMIVAAAALLAQTPHPSDEQIRGALARNLCRCGAYSRILKAVRRAAGGTS
ncbi:MAG TPA: (2Fe-2S)-binding protein [Caldilineaceae bacterium]|nr:(2Fe-2S)-binding protein [Caldilineaceae bacterium]